MILCGSPDFPYLQKVKSCPKVATPPNKNHHLVMSQHASLRKSSDVGTKRSVLKRFERVKLMQKRGEWPQGRTPLHLPKTAPEA